MLAAGLVVPFVVTDAYVMGLIVEIALLSMVGLSIGFLGKHLGLVSLGHTAFFGASAYGVGVGMNSLGLSPVAAVGFGILVGTLLALVMGVLVVRASGMGFLMLTLALSQALYQLNLQQSLRPITGAHDGLLLTWDSQATLLGLSAADVHNPGLFWPAAWTSLAVALIVLAWVGRSRFGIELEGIRENEERMRFSGYNTFVPRLMAFQLSGVIAAVAGALYALHTGYVSPDLFSFVRAGDALSAVLIGGMGTLIGPVLGTAIFVWAEANLNVGGNLHLYTGLTLIVVLVFLPGGITGTLQRLRRRNVRTGRTS